MNSQGLVEFREAPLAFVRQTPFRSRRSAPQKSSTRRILTLMFADLQGSTSLAQVLDLDAYDTLIRQFHKMARDVIEGHQGDVVQVYGDGVLSVFGLRVDGEDSAFAATQAALSLTGSFPKAFPGQSLRVGLHSGNVMCHRDASAPELVTGFDVNLTARIQSQAAPNGVMASASTYALLHNIADVNVSSRRLARLKGVAKETELVEIKSIRFRDRVAANTALIGRDDFLARLEETPRGCGRVIIGPGGIGKTSVLDELSRRIGQRARTVTLCARSNVHRSPLFPFRRWLEATWDEVLDLARRRLNALELSVLTSLRFPEEADKMLVSLDSHKLGMLRIATLCKLLRTYLDDARAAFFFDDMQWADAQSRQLIHNLLQDSAQRPFRLFLFARDVHSFSGICAHPQMERHDLAPLRDDDALDVLRNAQAAPLDTASKTALLKSAAGNPLYLLSLLHKPQTGSDLPQSIEASIQSQLDVGPAHMPTLSVAAVLGQVFPHSHLRLFQDDPLAQAHAIEHLVRRGILNMSKGSISFCHPLYREVAYDMIPQRERQSIHLRAALAISKKDLRYARAFPELLADHAISAKAWGVIPKFAIVAASHMIKQASHDQALYYIDAANAAIAAAPDSAARGSGNETTVLSLKAAVEIQKFGYVHRDVLRSHHALEQVALNDRNESFARMLAYHSTTSHRLISQSIRPSRALVKSAGQLAASGTVVEQLLHLVHAAVYNLYSGRFDLALAVCQRVRDIYNPRYHANLVFTIGADPLTSALSVSMRVHALRGHSEISVAEYEQARAHAQQISAQRQLPSLAIDGGVALCLGGARRKGMAMLQDGLQIADAQGARLWQSNARAWHATLRILSGQITGQADRLAHQVQKLNGMGVALSLPVHEAAQALAQQASGDRDDAACVVRRALRTVLHRDEVIWLPVLLAMQNAVNPASRVSDRHAWIEKSFRNRATSFYSVPVPTVQTRAVPRQMTR